MSHFSIALLVFKRVLSGFRCRVSQHVLSRSRIDALIVESTTVGNRMGYFSSARKAEMLCRCLSEATLLKSPLEIPSRISSKGDLRIRPEGGCIGRGGEGRLLAEIRAAPALERRLRPTHAGARRIPTSRSRAAA